MTAGNESLIYALKQSICFDQQKLWIDAHTSSTRWRSFQVSLASLKKVYRHHFRNFRKKIVIYMKITISPLFRLHLEFVKWWSVLICILNVLFCSLSLFYAYTTFALLYCAVKIGQSQISASKQTPNTNLISIFFSSRQDVLLSRKRKSETSGRQSGVKTLGWAGNVTVCVAFNDSVEFMRALKIKLFLFRLNKVGKLCQHSGLMRMGEVSLLS